ncbi:hypothetical protein [Streptomyces showdoensis]|uniref:Band 7 domain-containing protein n=1 Tax=Streptomyces showdoensis TaxID=68268 RepID=A0A2P2GEX1_STREW|nr:hypothetical protein [Streptomyces showdoensis]KKZ70070.1 hypothetical protein VO63_30850 [Streptomyces showdoensis]
MSGPDQGGAQGAQRPGGRPQDGWKQGVPNRGVPNQGGPNQGRQRAGAGGGNGSGRASGKVAKGPLGPLIREVPPPYRRTSGLIAAVLLYRNGGHRIVWPDRQEDNDKPLLRAPYTVFEVQLGQNVTEFSLKLPAAGDGASFNVRVRVKWTVEDPYRVVKEQVWNVAELLHDDLLDGLRSLSRRFRLTEAQRADEAVRDELSTGRLVLGREIGLRTQVYVFFDLDEQIRKEVARADKVEVTVRADAREAEAELRREEWERKKIMARAADLEAMFRRGDLAQIAHHMAKNPDHEWEIRTQLQREKREGQADLLAVFNRLLDSGVLERHEVDEQAYQILQHLRSSTGTILGGVADRVLESSRAPDHRALERASAPEPTAPNWDDEETRDAPPDPRVYEPTRVQASFEREQDRDRDRDRDRGRSRDRDWDRDLDRDRDRHDEDRDRGRGPDWDRYDEDDRTDARDRGRDRDRGRGGDGGRDRRDDGYDTGRPTPRPEPRSARPSADFDDWDDE